MSKTLPYRYLNIAGTTDEGIEVRMARPRSPRVYSLVLNYKEALELALDLLRGLLIVKEREGVI